MNIYPLPFEVLETDGKYSFGKQMVLTVSESFEDDEYLNFYCKLWKQFTCDSGELSINKVTGKNNVAVLSEKSSKLPSSNNLNEFEYRINANNDKVILEYSEPTGLLHALSTVLQLIEAVSLTKGQEAFMISCCKISDKPALKFRGVHICVFPETTLAFLQKAVRMAGFLKYSHIVIEFWGMLKFDAMKELSWPNAFTKEQIRTLIAQANALGMEVIPMFNHLGHATLSRVRYGKHVVLDQNPQKQLFFEPDGWTWCISNPETVKLLREIRKELIELCGNSGYFHLGCDEAYSFATCKICQKQDKPKLLETYLNTVAEELSAMGIRGILWGDSFLNKDEWQSQNYIASLDNRAKTYKVLENLDRRFIIDDWQYGVKTSEVKTSKFFNDKGFEVLLSPYNERENIKALACAAIENNYKGILATTWNILHDNISLIPYAAEFAWAGKRTINNENTDALILTYTASFLRKLSPSKGDYKNSGWNEVEETLQ